MVLSMKNEMAEKEYVTVDLVVPEPLPIQVEELTETVQKQQVTIEQLNFDLEVKTIDCKCLTDELRKRLGELRQAETVNLVPEPEPLPIPVEEEPEPEEEPEEEEEEEEVLHENPMMNFLMKQQLKLDNPEDSEEEEEEEEVTPVKQHDLSTDLGRHDAAQEEKTRLWRERNKKREEADAKRQAAYKNTDKGRSWERLKNGFTN